jgi:tetratricopeptide (TPR) repeat protein
MAPNPYDNCPCGSGKKFKWCCSPYWEKIEQGLDLYQQGQLENALRVMESLVKEHPQYPQTWGYYAHILFREGKMEEAEQKLQKAFELNPNFAMGHLLRGLFRQSEGEVIGALLLYRKAADAYPPEAHDQLAQVYEMIARNELILNRMVACRAALERACNAAPYDQEMRAQYEGMFGDESRTPACVRKKYTFRPTVRPVAVSESGRFSDARAAYEDLTKQVPTDPAAWFNLGLVRAWLGDQGPAVEALNKSLELEYADPAAEETAALVEVLKCGHGMAEESDYVEHRAYFQIRDPRAMTQLIQAWMQEGRMLSPQFDESQTVLSSLLVEELPSIVETGTKLAKVVASVTVGGGTLRLWHSQKENVTKLAVEVRDRLQLAVSEAVEGTGPAQFAELVQEAVAYPLQVADMSQAQQKMADYAAAFYENVWSHRPLKAFGGVSPIDAAGSKLLRKRLLGVIKLHQDCVEASAPRMNEEGNVVPIRLYDFDKLRHRLGAEKQTADGPPPDLLAAAQKRDFSAMSAADLGGLNMEQLSGSELEDAMKAALKLDARELAIGFAKTAVAKPVDPTKVDRYPLYLCLISSAISDGKPADALAHTKDGMAYDKANNGGKRANEYGVRAAQLFAKTGDVDGSVAAFNDLIARNPDEAKYYVTAIETMLSAKQGAKATAFAERGLEKAKATGNRDLEGACLELGEAAKRLK